MKQILMFFIFSAVLFLNSLPSVAQDGLGGGLSMEEKQQYLQQMDPAQKRALFDQLAASGQKPILSQVWPHLTEDQKTAFIDGDMTAKREIIRGHVQTLPMQEKMQFLQMMKQQGGMDGMMNGGAFGKGGGTFSGGFGASGGINAPGMPFGTGGTSENIPADNVIDDMDMQE